MYLWVEQKEWNRTTDGLRIKSHSWLMTVEAEPVPPGDASHVNCTYV